ncbi:MAG: protein kinase [Thermoprotei archaeon]|nr:MAG: protein kinase [Thermoprotei archaeon]
MKLDALLSLFKFREKRKEKAKVAKPSFVKPEYEYEVVESYWVLKPFAKVDIGYVAEEGSLFYFVIEEQLDPYERRVYEKLIDFLGKELEPPEDPDVDPIKYVTDEARRILDRYRRSFRVRDEHSKEKILYYVARDLAGYGPIHVMMLDPNIEDISCNGVGRPIYVWHRRYESLPTNVVFTDERELDDFIIKLAHMAGKHVSSAHPIIDATLPGKHRLAATFMREVSTSGSTFCIRKFREKPFSIIELIDLGTLNEIIAAYLWILVENKMSLMIIGGTGSGKTTTLNAILSMIRPEMKIVTVEETAEINLIHDNWVQFIARESFKFGATSETASITLFDLVKTSLRYRPDYLIVGEIRGEEAYVLFQAIATGHGGICTMHADSLEYAIKRLTSKPMNIAPIYIPLMNACLLVERVKLPFRPKGPKFGRRIRNIWEIEDYGRYRVIASWDPVKDTFNVNLSNSILLDRIATRLGISKKDVIDEIRRRSLFLRELKSAGVMEFEEVTKAIREYYISVAENLGGGRK